MSEPLEPDVTQPRRPRGRDQGGTRRRAQLLKAARDRFAILGYDRTTVRDIADDVGVNVALVNRYFGTKRKLYEAVLTEAWQPPLLEAGPTTIEALTKLLVEQLAPSPQRASERHDTLAMLLRGAEDDDQQVTALRQKALDAMTLRILRAAGPDAPEQPDESQLLAAQLVLAVIAGAGILRTSLPIHPLADVTVDRLQEPLERAIRALLAGM